MLSGRGELVEFSGPVAPSDAETLIQTGACAVELPDTRPADGGGRRRCWWGRGRGVCPLPLCRVCMCVGDMIIDIILPGLETAHIRTYKTARNPRCTFSHFRAGAASQPRGFASS